MDLKIGFVCDRGLNPKRPVNQDRYLSIPERGLFAVFDGVGGQRAGEVASQTAAETIEEALTETPSAPNPEAIGRAIRFANRDIFEMAESDPAYKTMATTVALIQIDDRRAIIAHAGDSRIYRLEEGKLYRETIDHTDLFDDVRAGVITPKQAAEQSSRNVINRALGAEPDIEVEIKTINVRDGTRFLLCSDGIYRHLSDEEIGRVLAQVKDPQSAADELKRIVHERGADDNLTAVVVQVGRARQSAVLAIEDGMPGSKNVQPVGVRATDSLSTAQQVSRATSAVEPESTKPGYSNSGRIRVEIGGARAAERSVGNERAQRTDEQRNIYSAARSFSEPDRGVSPWYKWLSLILGLMILAAAAVAYMKWPRSDSARDQTSNPAGQENPLQPLRDGRDAYEKGDYQTAETHFASLVSREPQNPEAHLWLGRAQLARRDLATAAQSFEQAIRLQPSMYEAYRDAALAYEVAGDSRKARRMLTLAAEQFKQSASR
ncbi:MAG TPA: protein phosphatase 2C domain-containing protein [Blastocatellia bacterium]|nr:protein phosphatase 2C domain-containing protein [Blastocatellia bacterium]